MNPESRQKAGLWLAAVFILGAAIGGVFGYSFSQRHALAAPPAATPLSEQGRRAKRVSEMTKEMNLTPEQTSAFDNIIHQAHDEMRAIHDKSDWSGQKQAILRCTRPRARRGLEPRPVRRGHTLAGARS